MPTLMTVRSDIPPDVDDVCRHHQVILVVSQLDRKIKAVKVVKREIISEEVKKLNLQYPTVGYWVIMATISPFALAYGAIDIKEVDINGVSSNNSVVDGINELKMPKDTSREN